MKAHRLGNCYVCGKAAYGFRAATGTTTTTGKGVVRDINGIRHGGCDPFRVSRRASRVTPSDA